MGCGAWGVGCGGVQQGNRASWKARGRNVETGVVPRPEPDAQGSPSQADVFLHRNIVLKSICFVFCLHNN